MGESRKGRVMVQTNDGELAGIRRGGEVKRREDVDTGL